VGARGPMNSLDDRLSSADVSEKYPLTPAPYETRACCAFLDDFLLVLRIEPLTGFATISIV